MSLEKAIVQTLEPVVEKIVELEGKLQSIELQHGKDGKDGRDGVDGKDADVSAVAEVVKADESFVAGLRGKDGKDGLNGKDGRDGADGKNGADGIGIKAVTQDGSKIEIELDNDQLVFLELPQGPSGEKGDSGADGKDGIGINVKLWEQRIYRKGELVQANIGQIFEAQDDTNDVPGRSETWKRLGSAGFRWTGLKKADFAYQDGDLYIDNGSCFLWQNGKGHMFCQRGRDGKDGKDGLHGKDGRNAPKFVHLEFIGTKMVVALDDGAVLEADFVEMGEVRKQLTYLDQQFQALSEPIDTPIKRYAGIFKVGADYAQGDTVTFNASLYLCIKSDANSVGMVPESWVKLAGKGGGGGGGGGGGLARTSTIIGDGALNMANFLMTNLGDPRSGAVGLNDAVNRKSMEQAIAAGSLYQGIYKPATNAPNLATQTDSGFTAPVAGDKVAEPNTAAPQPNAANVLVWFNFKNHGLDTFSATTAAPIQIEVTYSDGTKSDVNLPAGTYANVAAVETALNALLTGTKVIAYHGYVNGADFWLGVETLPAAYAVSLAGSTGGGFGAAAAGANNKVLNTYNWVVSTADPNTPEYAPAGIPGINPGTTLRNSDILQWNGNLKQFEIIRGGNLTQSFADSRYWQLTRGNMAWVDQAYAPGSIVYSQRHNAWFTAIQNITIGTAEPGGNMPLVRPPIEWKKVNASYGSHVFFGRGDYNTADTTAANNWGMPTNTFPPGQQPETGDSYYDLLTGAVAEFNVTKNRPVYVITGTTALPPAGRLSQLTFADLANLATLARPPMGGYFTYSNVSAAPETIVGGPLDGRIIAAGHRLYLIWSGDPDADNGGYAIVDRAVADDPAPPLPWTVNTPHPQAVPDTIAATILWGDSRRGKVTIPTGTTAGTLITLIYGIPTSESFSNVTIQDEAGNGAIYSFNVLTSTGQTPEISPVSALARNTHIKEFYVKELDATDKVAVIIVLRDTLTANLVLDVNIGSKDFDLADVRFNADITQHRPATLANTTFFGGLHDYPEIYYKNSEYTYDTPLADQDRLLVNNIPNQAAVYTVSIFGKGNGVRGLVEFELIVNASAWPQLKPLTSGFNTTGHALFKSIKIGWSNSGSGFNIWGVTNTDSNGRPYDITVRCNKPNMVKSLVVFDGTYSGTFPAVQAEWVIADTPFVGPFQQITKADYTALTTKNPNILYLVAG